VVAFGALTATAFWPTSPASAVAAKSGAACKTAGATSGSLVCTRKAGKLVWSRATGTKAAAGTSAGIEGTWKPTSKSVLGYRVKEVIAGQKVEGIGRTSAITGSLTIAGTQVTDVDLTVDMATFKSDKSRRDGQFNSRIMAVSEFPKGTLKLKSPIDLGKVPADKEEIKAKATATLTLRGTAKEVTFDVIARRNGANVEVNGSIPILFSDYGIPNPSIGPITTEDNGLLEFVVVFAK
jgi:polyisoprenoid-binding protein YceI